MMPELGLVKTTQLAILDLDGTLVDSAPDIRLALNQALISTGKQVSLAQVQTWIGRGSWQLISQVGQALELQASTWEGLHQRYLAFYTASPCQESQLYDGVLAFLTQAKARQWHLACLTNKNYEIAVGVLTHLNIKHYFAEVVGGDTLPQRKPDPAGLYFLMQKLNVNASHTMMIGDSRHDIEAARAAGVYSVAVTYGYNHGEAIAVSQPDLILDSLAEIF